MPNITVNKDLTSHVVSDDGSQEFFLAAHNVLTLEPFTSQEQVEAFILNNITKYNWWQPFVDPAVREQERLDGLAAANRTLRDQKLSETDWVVVMHTEKGTNIPLEWETYRQGLRDITSHENWPELSEADWPVKP